MPFTALALGAARSIVENRGEPFVSIEDLRQRTRISAACIDQLRDFGALKGLSDTNQVDFFSLL